MAALGAIVAIVVTGLAAITALPRLSQHRATTLSAPGAGASTNANAGADAAGKAVPQPGPQPQVFVTGTDYNAATLTAAAGLGSQRFAASNAPGVNAAGAPELSVPAASDGAVPDQLRRLTEPVARSACLGAIERTGRGTVTAIDYARFQGSPALVVLLSRTDTTPAQRQVVVVGPRCGESGTIDEKYSAPIA
jgi:hypothetical protein